MSTMPPRGQAQEAILTKITAEPAVGAVANRGIDFGVDVNARDYLRVILRHSRLMAAVFLAVLVGSVVYALVATPVWQSTVTVKLPDTKQGFGASDQLKDLMMLSTSDPVETYMEVARSFNVAERAAEASGLTASAQFASAKDVTAAAEMLLTGDKVRVNNVKMSNVLSFVIQVQDPQLSVRLANAWAKSFIDTNLEFNRTGASSRRTFIEGQLAEIKVTLTEGEEALKRLSQRQGTLHSEGASAGMRDNPILALQTKVQDLLIERSDLSSRYGPDYPRVKEVEAEYKGAVAELNRQMGAMPANDMEYARLAREVKANETIYNLLLEKLQEARISENVDDSGIVVVDVARPAHSPVWPKKGRILGLGLLLGLLLSVFVGWSFERWLDEVGGEDELAKLCGLPVLAMVPDWRVEVSETSKLKASDMQKALSQPAGRFDPSSLIINPQLKHSYYNEAYKVLRTSLAFSQVDRSLKSFSILSANEKEGKTLTNANLALALAAAGKKVLLVDADLRRPSVHKLFSLNVGKDQGLPLLLSRQSAGLNMHLHPGPVPNLWLLPCGVIAPNPSELLGSSALKKALVEMTRRFDHVIFDAPPVLPVTDGVVLAAHLDGVALLARFERTRRVEYRRALAHLASVNAFLVGSILNGVDMRKYSYAYGYRDRYYTYQKKQATRK